MKLNTEMRPEKHFTSFLYGLILIICVYTNVAHAEQRPNILLFIGDS